MPENRCAWVNRCRCSVCGRWIAGADFDPGVAVAIPMPYDSLRGTYSETAHKLCAERAYHDEMRAQAGATGGRY